MEIKKTSLFTNGLIWFGAGVSIAEIITGTYFASLGFKKGLYAIIIGHIIGVAFMFAAGLIGARTRSSAMETVKFSFGEQGGKLFAALNVIQLVGWTAIMIYDGALAANEAIELSDWVWPSVIGGLIIVWILLGVTDLKWISTIAMASLFALTVVLSVVIFSNSTSFVPAVADVLSFGAAVELAATMPLSWLPVISDYTKDAEKPFKATLVSTVTYGLVSIWMYVIGMGAALYTGESDIALIMIKAGFGIAGLLIVVFSTVTTTFLDAFSAGISSVSLLSRLNVKVVSVITTVIGIVGAIFYPMYDITNFLYFIGSVFAPMAAVLIVDYYVFNKDKSGMAFDVGSLVVWGAGFAIYRYLININFVLGATLPDIFITMLLAYAIGKIKKR